MEKPNPFRIFNTLNKLIIKPNKKTMTRNEQQMYSDITSIRKSLEKIANALDNNVTQTTKDIPGFEGTLNDLDNISLDYLNAEDKCKAEAEYTYDNDLNEYKYVSKVGKIKNDSDFDIRVTAKMYEDDVLANGGTKKDCILDYVTNEFGSHGARYTDIIKFAYYLGAHNAPKYTSENRGYYAMAFASRYGGHLIQGGKDFLVKGINKEGKERYFAHSSVDSFTDYYKEIS